MTNKITKLMLNWEEYEIREYVEPGRQPGVNTIAYYPLDSTNTVNDKTTNHYDLTNYVNDHPVLFWTYQWVDCAYFDEHCALGRSWNPLTWHPELTMSLWCYRLWQTKGYNQNLVGLWSTNATNAIILWLNHSGYNLYLGWRTNDRNTWYTLSTGSWTNVIATYDGGTTVKIYINNQSPITLSVTQYTLWNWYINIWSWVWQQADGDSFYWYISNVIIEDKARSAQEISDYYNQTKSLYGIS